MLVDRPEQTDRAVSRFPGRHIRRMVQGGGLLTLPKEVPPGAQIYVLKHVLHGCEDETAVVILPHCRSVLPAEGRVLVIEFVLPDLVDHVDRDIEFRLMSDLNMLAVSGGKERSAIQWKQVSASAGFQCGRITPVPGDLVSIIEAVPAT
jgi:O-methyltransferase domain